jgi:hypothetical protein
MAEKKDKHPKDKSWRARRTVGLRKQSHAFFKVRLRASPERNPKPISQG